jgi:hypothetical protein
MDLLFFMFFVKEGKEKRVVREREKRRRKVLGWEKKRAGGCARGRTGEKVVPWNSDSGTSPSGNKAGVAAGRCMLGLQGMVCIGIEGSKRTMYLDSLHSGGSIPLTKHSHAAMEFSD